MLTLLDQTYYEFHTLACHLIGCTNDTNNIIQIPNFIVYDII